MTTRKISVQPGKTADGKSCVILLAEQEGSDEPVEVGNFSNPMALILAKTIIEIVVGEEA